MPNYGRNPRYGGYRGRKSGGASKVLKVVALVLAIVLALLAAALFFLQDYLVYSDEGVRFQPPWLAEEPAQSVAPAPSESVPVLITDAPEESDPAEEEPQLLHAIGVSQTALLAGTAAEQVTAAGGNALVVTMKNDDGTLNYVSAVPLAVEAGASGADPDANAALRALTGGELYTVAALSCFRDHALPGYDGELAIHTNSGYRWLDHEDLRWASPASETVTGYLTDLCVELAELGFDEILLTNCGYPTADTGNLGWIRQGEAYPVGSLDTVIARFLTQVRTALEPYGVKLSVEAAAGELAGETAHTGLSLTTVTDGCDRFWVDETQLAPYPALAGEEGLVRVVSAPGMEDAVWAVLP